MFFDIELPRGFATTTVLILVSISLNALFLGVIGEYLGRMYRQIKRLPMTIIDKTLNADGHLDL
jgi:dolichol-phosphate mannosyltransferase